MKRFLVAIIIIGILFVGLMPVSAKSILPEQSQLPIPQGFCIEMIVPVYDEGIIFDFLGNSVSFAPVYINLFFSEDLQQDMYEVRGWIFTDEVKQVISIGPGIEDFGVVGFEGLGGDFIVEGNATLKLLPANACSFPAYRDNAALAQTFLVPETGYDVYQIFDGAGIFSFRVTQDDLANAEAGDVLGSNEAGNITFTYNGNGVCTVTYPYTDGKTGSKSFICQGKITDWGRLPVDPNFFLPPLSN